MLFIRDLTSFSVQKENILFVSVRNGPYKEVYCIVWDLFYVSKELNLSLPSLSRHTFKVKVKILHYHTAWFYFCVFTSCIHLTIQDKIKHYLRFKIFSNLCDRLVMCSGAVKRRSCRSSTYRWYIEHPLMYPWGI